MQYEGEQGKYKSFMQHTFPAMVILPVILLCVCDKKDKPHFMAGLAKRGPMNRIGANKVGGALL